MKEEILIKKNEIQKEKNDKKRINLINNLAHKISYNNPKDALELSEEAYNLSLKLEYQAGMGYSLKNKGTALIQLGEFKRSLFFLFRSLNIFNEIDDIEGKISALNGIGISFFKLDNYTEALNYYYASLGYIKTLNRKSYYISNMNNIALVYSALKEYENALECLNQLLKEDISDDNIRISILANIGDTYYDIKNYEKALEYYKKSLNLIQNNPNKSVESNILWRLGIINIELENYDLANEYLNKGLEEVREVGLKNFEGRVILSIGNMYIKKGDYKKAIKYLDEAYKIGEKGNYENLIHQVHEAYSKAYGLNNDFQKSLEHYEKYHEYEKKIRDREEQAKIRNITLAHEIEKKQIETDVFSQYQKDNGEEKTKAYLLKQIEKQNEFINKKLLRYRYPSEIIYLTVIWYIDFNLSYRELSAMLLERGIEVSHETVHKWVRKFSKTMKDLKLNENKYYSLYWKIEQSTVEILGNKYFYYKALNSYEQLLDFYLSEEKNQRKAEFFLRQSIATPISKPDITELITQDEV